MPPSHVSSAFLTWQVAFTGENLRTGSLVNVQQKGLTGVDRIYLALQYTALVEVEAGGVTLSE